MPDVEDDATYDLDEEANEDRADSGETIVLEFARVRFFSNPADADDPEEVEANREDIISDLVAAVAHYCERWGIDPDERIPHGLQSYHKDRVDDPECEGIGCAPAVRVLV